MDRKEGVFSFFNKKHEAGCNYRLTEQGANEMTYEESREMVIEALTFYLELGGYFEDYEKRDQARATLKTIKEND